MLGGIDNLRKMNNLNKPYRFVGIQKGFQNLPDIELYDLLIEIDGHPMGSTVSKDTLVQKGIWVG